MTTFAVLGNIIFQPLNSPQSFESSRGWDFAEHKTIESAPKLQWIGEALEEVSLDILLHVLVNNPAVDRATLYAAAGAHRALALVWGNGQHRGYYVITSIAESASKLGGDGSIISLTLKLKLKQWARSIEIDPNAPPQPAAPPPGIIIGATAPGQSVAGVVAADGTVTFPSAQAGTSAVVNNPASSIPPSGNFDLASNAVITRMDPAAGAVLT